PRGIYLHSMNVLHLSFHWFPALTLKCYSCSTPVPPETCTETANCNSQSTQNMLLTCFAYESSLFLMLFFADGTVVKSCSASCGILSCYTCSATNCLNTLACKGDESQCITATGDS
uniref:Uncharacterized protein n=1 Tax=Cyprinus carpio TaxID=7962 RepID=A0A8C2KP43_CYPCA